ncbi:MFS transporter [Croceicoccus naphthovorans]|nr:MFS transporter [Croceicoccus naphthovorans]
MPGGVPSDTEHSAIAALDQGRLRAIQIRVFLLCALVTMLDGIDNQSIGVVAPLMSAELGLNKAAMGLIFSLTQVGATIGALALGPFGDRFGRRPAIILSVSTMTVFTLLTALVPSFGLLLATRFLAGIGLAGVFASALALTSEYAPTRLRGTMVSVVYAGYPAGAALGGVMAAVILQQHDWRLVLYMGAALGALVIALVLLLLPESPRFLIEAGTHRERLDRLLMKLGLDPAAAGVSPAAVSSQPRPRQSLWSVFEGGLAPLTVLLCLLNLFVSATTKIMVVWFPSVLADSGFSISQAAFSQAAFNIGCVAAMLIAGWLVDRFGALRTIVPALFFDALSIWCLGFTAGNFAVTIIVASLVGAFIGIGASGAQALAAQLFPVRVRSTGIGWATSAARFGQVISPLLVGVVLAGGMSASRIFAGLALSPLLAALVAAAFVHATRRREEKARAQSEG